MSTYCEPSPVPSQSSTGVMVVIVIILVLIVAVFACAVMKNKKDVMLAQKESVDETTGAQEDAPRSGPATVDYPRKQQPTAANATTDEIMDVSLVTKPNSTMCSQNFEDQRLYEEETEVENENGKAKNGLALFPAQDKQWEVQLAADVGGEERDEQFSGCQNLTYGDLHKRYAKSSCVQHRACHGTKDGTNRILGTGNVVSLLRGTGHELDQARARNCAMRRKMEKSGCEDFGVQFNESSFSYDMCPEYNDPSDTGPDVASADMGGNQTTSSFD